MSAEPSLPLPPLELRTLVGPTDAVWFDNPTGGLVFDVLPPEAYETVLDFGCGCGRIARQLIQQRPRPRGYVGIDLHRGMIDWCRANLAPAAPGFEFRHHDVRNAFLNPGDDKPTVLPFPVEAASRSLVIGWSVFTHLTEDQVVHYLAEARRVLVDDGVLLATWFLFDKREFPMLTAASNALYASYTDPATAVAFDRGWICRAAQEAGLAITFAQPPTVRGSQWVVVMAPRTAATVEVELPRDDAPVAPEEVHRSWGAAQDLARDGVAAPVNA